MRSLLGGAVDRIRGELRGLELEKGGRGGGGGQQAVGVRDGGDGGGDWGRGVDSAAAVAAALRGRGEGRVGGEFAGEGWEIGGGFEELGGDNSGYVEAAREVGDSVSGYSQGAEGTHC